MIQPCLKSSPGYNTLRCIAIQSLATSPSQVMIHLLYCDPFPIQASLLYCNTNFSLLRYTSPFQPPCHNTLNLLQYKTQPTTHPRSMSRYNTPLYRDTVWAVAQSVPAIFFFVFFFSFLPATRKYKNIYTYFFFLIFQNTQINL